jgi:superfamily II DNA or RNA helicase
LAGFLENDRVSQHRNANLRGRIANVSEPSGGHQFYTVIFDNGELQYCEESELIREVIINTPWDLMKSNSLCSYQDFSISSTVHKVRNTTSNTISTLKASRTIFKPYQYKPLVKFLNSDLKRLLIADEVGLGKTIEAGHIMLELAARGQLQNALIICTNSLKDKWKTELKDKFNFHFKIFESGNEFMRDIEDDISSNKRSILGIINYEKCRSTAIKECIESNEYKFDMLICDEAHKIRNSETAQHRGVKTIIGACEAAVFLTATPIMTDIRNLHSLVKVLDPVGFETFDIFNNAIRLNRPFIKALSQLNSKVPLVQIATELGKSKVIQEHTAQEELFQSSEFSVDEIFKDDKLYQRLRNSLFKNEDNPNTRAIIQQDLVDLNSLNHLYTRTRKKEVQNEQDVVQRNAKSYRVPLSDEELAVYNGIIDQYDDNHNLGLIQRKRQVSSSIIGFQIDNEEEIEEFVKSAPTDTKYSFFRDIVSEVIEHNNRKLIVFAFFKKTLKYLKARLELEGIRCEIIHGGINDRTKRIERFRDDSSIKVLLSSEVGSEGLDLQFCDALVNYDLPWNPMIVEQRIGRIDRVGQRSKKIHIFNLILKDTIEERIHDRLYERIELFKESIGDLEEILGETEPLGEKMAKEIEGLYREDLTEEQQNERLDQLSIAFENEKLTLIKVQMELADAFANDVHFQNEIIRIQNNRRYLTEYEIIQFIESGIRRSLNFVQLIHIGNKRYELKIPATSNKDFFNFVEKYKNYPKNSPEIDVLYNQFKMRHFGAERIELTFNQEHAFTHKKLEFISAFHPLVNALTNYFTAENLHQNQAHKLTVRKADFDKDININPGYYVLATFKVSIIRYLGDERENRTESLKASLADLNGDDVNMINQEYAEQLMGQIQLYGQPFTENLNLDAELVGAIREPIMAEMRASEMKVRENESIKFHSALERRYDQELRYIESWLNRKHKQLAEGIGIENIVRAEINKLNTRKEGLKEQIGRASLDVTHSMISANLIKIK